MANKDERSVAQAELFPEPQDQELAELNQGVKHLPAWLPQAEADNLQQHLEQQLNWEQHRLMMFGRWVDEPRLSVWIGEQDYRYSGQLRRAQPWTTPLLALRQRLERYCQAPFNTVLTNYYRDGKDSMGWHGDNETELGSTPIIASLSLGAPRRFLFKRRGSTRRHAYNLGHGDLLIMHALDQNLWQHSLPKMTKLAQARLNLTFRYTAESDQNKDPG